MFWEGRDEAGLAIESCEPTSPPLYKDPLAAAELLPLLGPGKARLFEGVLCCDCLVVIGVSVLVDRLTISFPCTTRFSFDFLRSRVSISISRQQVALHKAAFQHTHLE